MHNYFDYKAELARRELNQLPKQGRMSLVIGVSFLAVCLLTADVTARLATGTFLTIVRESLTIGGRVAMLAAIADISVRLVAAATTRQGLP